MDEAEPGAIPAVEHVDIPVKLPPSSSKKEKRIEEKKQPDRPLSPRPFDETIKVNQLKELDDIMAQLHDTGPAKKPSKAKNDPSETKKSAPQKPKTPPVTKTETPKPNPKPTNNASSGRITPISAPPERTDVHAELEGNISPATAPVAGRQPPISEIPIRKPYQETGRHPLGTDQRMYIYPVVSDVTSDTGDYGPNSQIGPMLMQNPEAFVNSPTPKIFNTTSGAFPHQQSYPLETTGAPLDISPSNSIDDNDNNWSNADYTSDDNSGFLNHRRTPSGQESLDSAGNPKQMEADSTRGLVTHCNPVNVCLADVAKTAEAFYTSVGRSIVNENMLPEEPENDLNETQNVTTEASPNSITKATTEEAPNETPGEKTDTVPVLFAPIAQKAEEAGQETKEAEVQHQVGQDTKDTTTTPQKLLQTNGTSSEPKESSPSSRPTSPEVAVATNPTSPVPVSLTEVEVSRESPVPMVSYTEIDPMLLEQGLSSSETEKENSSPKENLLLTGSSNPAPYDKAPSKPDLQESSLSSRCSYTISSVDYTVEGTSTMQGSISGDSTNTSSPRDEVALRSKSDDALMTLYEVPSDPLSDAILKGASVGAALLGIDTEPKPSVQNRTIDFEEVKENERNLEKLNVSADTKKAGSAFSEDHLNDEEAISLSKNQKSQLQQTTPDSGKSKSKRKFLLIFVSILVFLVVIIIVIVALTSSSSPGTNSIAGNFGAFGDSSESPSFPSSLSPVTSPVSAPSMESPAWSPVVPEDDEDFVEETDSPQTSPSALAPVSSSNSPPTNAPVADLSPNERQTMLENMFKSMTYSDVEYGMDTPEGNALTWMVDQDTLDPADSSAENQMRLTQRYALMTIYYSSVDSEWEDDTEWGSEDECTWFGVVCRGSSVVRLELLENNLSGSISPDIALLTSLEGVIMNGNSLEGMIPQSFTDLENIRVIAFRDNELSGQLNSFDFSALQRLRVLDVNNNEFNGEIPSSIFSKTTMTYLDVGDNGFTGSLSEEISQMDRLRFFNVSNNDMTGSIPSSITDVLSLEVFDFSSNAFTGPIPLQMDDLRNLDTFIAMDNNLQGEIPPAFGSLTYLETLRLEGNSLTGTIPEALSSLTNLETLTLGNNDFRWSYFPEFVYEFKNLTMLHLDNCMMFGGISDEIANLENLSSLRLDNNFLNETIPVEMGELENLELLRLDGNYLFGEVPTELGNLVKLIELRINFNQLSGTLPPIFGDLSELQRLTVGGNFLSGSLPESLTSLSKLEFFSCEDSFFEGPIPEDIGDMESLEVFRCHLNRWEGETRGLTGSIPKSISKLQNLRTFLVYQNSLDGTIPRELGDIETLQIIDLELNRLGGPVPESLGNLENLRVLRMGGNPNLQGVPSSLCELDSLEIYRAGCLQDCTCCTDECGSRDIMQL